MSEQIPKPKFKSGDIIVCNDPVSLMKGVLFLVKKVDEGVVRNAAGNITQFGCHSYLLEYLVDGVKNRAKGTIIDAHWDLAPPEARILYGTNDSPK